VETVVVGSGFGIAGTLLTSWAEMWAIMCAGSNADVEAEHYRTFKI